jgi:predicted dinucleotide-binding enzyme
MMCSPHAASPAPLPAPSRTSSPRCGSSPTPAIWFCDDAAAAEAQVATLIDDLGFDHVDVGGLVQARYFEHLTRSRRVGASASVSTSIWCFF